jgi:hypothetical protein
MPLNGVRHHLALAYAFASVALAVSFMQTPRASIMRLPDRATSA